MWTSFLTYTFLAFLFFFFFGIFTVCFGFSQDFYLLLFSLTYEKNVIAFCHLGRDIKLSETRLIQEVLTALSSHSHNLSAQTFSSQITTPGYCGRWHIHL